MARWLFISITMSCILASTLASASQKCFYITGFREDQLHQYPAMQALYPRLSARGAQFTNMFCQQLGQWSELKAVADQDKSTEPYLVFEFAHGGGVLGGFLCVFGFFL